jgi:hypothetical protein
LGFEDAIEWNSNENLKETMIINKKIGEVGIYQIFMQRDKNYAR